MIRQSATQTLRAAAVLAPSRRLFSAATYCRSGNPAEMAHFAELAQTWWDPAGPQRILHKMNLMRMDYIREVLADHAAGAPGYSSDLLPQHVRLQRAELPAANSLDVLDVGCGGGLLSESLARQPWARSVLGIDVTPEVLAVAREHAAHDPAALARLRYLHSAVEDLGAAQTFDIVTMFEVIEHLDDPAATLRAALDRVRPGGWIFLSTINRSIAAAFSTIFVAEYLLRIVPRGTHTYSKYINEPELRAFIAKQPGWQVASSQGCVYVPTLGWERFNYKSTGLGGVLNCVIGKDGGNYLLAARRNA